MSTALSAKAVGSTIKLNYNGAKTDFIILHQGKPSSMYDDSCTGTWVRFKYAFKLNKAWDAIDNDFENSDCRSDVEGLISKFDADIQGQIKQVKIPYHKGKGNAGSDQSGANGLPCKLFPLSMREQGITSSDYSYSPNDGSKLDYYESGQATDSAKNKRKMTLAYGTAAWVWSRSAGTSNVSYVLYVNTDGTCSNVNCGITSGAVCPAFVLPSTLLVSDNGDVVVNAPPEITSTTANGSNLGTKNSPISLTYKVTDQDNDPTTVREYIDNVLKREFTATLGANNTFAAIASEADFRKILNGVHTVKVTATDSQNNATNYSVSFTKNITTLDIKLKNPIQSAKQISAVMVIPVGSIPSDAEWLVEVTNNANDPEPVWEDCTIRSKNGYAYAFKNTTAANGFALNVRVRLSRGASGTGGHITSVQIAYETEE